MKYLLSFAIGAMLGDIFFHLIPESYQSHLDELNISYQDAHTKISLSIIAGIFMFMIMEMVLEKLSQTNEADPDKESPIKLNQTSQHMAKGPNNNDLNYIINGKHIENNNNNNNMITNFNHTPNGLSKMDILNNNNNTCLIDQNLKHRMTLNTATLGKNVVIRKKSSANGTGKPEQTRKQSTTTSLIGYRIDTAGYLSLIANGFDNFMHGLAIGASFLAGLKIGLITTFVIIIHEIPHEICDYAILVNSGFSRLKAVKFQSLVALFGVLGTAMALYVKSMDTLSSCTIWILPFSAGGFLHIALVNLLPEILDRETNNSNNIRQVACVILGVTFMAAVALFEF